VIDLNKISKKNAPKIPLVVIYGPEGIGKSTFGSMAKDSILILTEDGLGDIDATAIPQDENGKPRAARSYEEVMDCIQILATTDHDYKTVVIDTLDWFQPLVWKATCKRLNAKSIEDPGYGRGYVECMTEWQDFLDALTYLRDTKGMMVILVAHSAVVKIEDPLCSAYDKNTLKLQKLAAAKIVEWGDVVGFCSLTTLTRSEKAGFDKTRNIAVSTGQRVLHVAPTAGYVAKKRYRNMPDEMPLDYTEFEKYIPGGSVKKEE
jgi:hypothetical protein